jgi:hypothetical protein
MSSDPAGGRGDPKEEEQVRTPGGPRPKDLVELVEPGGTVRRNPDGTYTVVPKQAPSDREAKEGKG